MAKLRLDKIRAITRAHFKKQLEMYTDRIGADGFPDQNTESIKFQIESLAEAEQGDTEFSDLFINDDLLSDFRLKNDLSADDWADNADIFKQEVRRAQRDMLRQLLAAAGSLKGYSFDQNQAKASSGLSERNSAPLGEVLGEYMAENAHLWDEKYTNQIQAYMNVMLEYFGKEKQVSSITHQDANDLKKIVMSLPQHRHVKPELKNLPLLEVIQVAGQQPISVTTVNNHIQNYIRFFKWAANNGHVDVPLFEGMKVAKKKREDNKRKPFTFDQTALMFKELTENTSGLVRNESHKWGTLLAMFTGARVNEISQLHIADIKQEDEIWYLDITDEGDADGKKRVKAMASRRKVPLHSKLIEIGFLEFVATRKEQTRLLPDFSYTKASGYGRNLSRWVNETTLLPKLGLKTKQHVFHSFRHTMTKRLAHALVPDPILQCVVGHARSGVTQEVYNNSGYTLSHLKDAIEKFHFCSNQN